jgi:hypothetical protein
MNNVEATTNTMNDAPDASDFWHVQLPDGEVKLWSLDQLDAAFQAEIVDERCNVLKVGEMKWQPLGVLLGLDEEAPPPPPPSFAAPAQVTPTPAPFTFEAPESVGVLSIRPVVADVGDGFEPDEVAFAPKKRPVGVLAAVAALAIVGGVVALTRIGGAAPRASSAAAAGVVGPSSVAPGLPQPVAQAAPNFETAATGPRLSDDQKKALLEADKTHDDQRKARAAAAPKHTPKTTSKPVFHKGGSKYDPLNSSL